MNSSQSARTTWFIIFGALVFSVGIYGVLGFFMAQNPALRPAVDTSPSNFDPTHVHITIVICWTVWGWIRYKVDKKVNDELATPVTKAESFSFKIAGLALTAILFLGVGIFGLMGFKLAQPPNLHPPAHLATLRPFFTYGGFTMLLAAWVWLRLKIDAKMGGEGRSSQLTPNEFLTYSLVALALAETCAVVGLTFFFLGASLQEFGFFAAETLFFDFVFILPRGIRFWAMQG